MSISSPRYPGTPVRPKSFGLALTPSLGESLLRSASYLNDVSPTFTNASGNRFNPFDKTFAAANVRRRRPLYVGRNHQVQMDLIEGARTNLFTYSQDFSNAAWTKTATTVAADVAVAPDGSTTADSFTENTASSAHRSSRTVTITAASTISLSLYVKRLVGTRNAGLTVSDGTAQFQVAFNLSTGVLSDSSATGGGVLLASSITDVGAGWFRITASGTVLAGSTSINCFNQVLNGTTIGSNNYVGDGASSLILWGAQLEAAAFPSSYIPTTTVAVTRAADILSADTSGLAGGISATEGTIIAALVQEGWTSFTGALIGDASYGKLSIFTQEGGTVGRLSAYRGTSNGVTNYTLQTSAGRYTAAGLKKFAHKWDATNQYLFDAGVQLTNPALTNALLASTAVQIGNQASATPIHGWVALFYFPRALSATEVAAVHSALRI